MRTVVKKALLFLRTYSFLIKSGDLKTASFALHQVTESLFACLLLVKTGYKPRSHDLTSLEKRAANEIEAFDEAFPKETEEQRDLFELLNKAYIESRYRKKFSISRDELLWLEKPVLELKAVTLRLCQEEGVVTDLLDKVPPMEVTDEFMAELEKSWEDSDQKDLAMKTINRFRDEGYQLGEKDGLKKGKEEGFQLGEEAGLKKGKKEEALKIAKAMKEKGLDSQFIAETTGLSLELIEPL